MYQYSWEHLNISRGSRLCVCGLGIHFRDHIVIEMKAMWPVNTFSCSVLITFDAPLIKQPSDCLAVQTATPNTELQALQIIPINVHSPKTFFLRSLLMLS